MVGLVLRLPLQTRGGVRFSQEKHVVAYDEDVGSRLEIVIVAVTIEFKGAEIEVRLSEIGWGCEVRPGKRNKKSLGTPLNHLNGKR
ncbi:hypothetical protein J1N35_032191 [Gossypium stocksii]|uniref:Uncharacterized protein n=1 Tax=Gossypium stocksii TaxID=47602 RepID=A0A9D3V5Q2_9ROSI|nr:hypothetical protein J1N35_032191 [Gossypium stocksii]